MGEKGKVFWVGQNPGDRAVIHEGGNYYIAITPVFASMTIEQRLAVEALVREVGTIGEWVGQHMEIEEHG